MIEEFIGLLTKDWGVKIDNPLYISNTYQVTVKEIVDNLYEFKKNREEKKISNVSEKSFSQRLYSTYLTYLPKEQFKYVVEMNKDRRGCFAELFKTKERGQISINITKPGITKGEHWHHSKNEKFVVVYGKGWIRLRQIHSCKIVDFHVSGEKIEVIEIPPGYTHNIINEGETDLITIIWANENFCKENPDTYFLKVESDGGTE